MKKASEIDSVRICMLFCYEAQQCIISTNSTAVTYPLMPYFKHPQNRLHQYIEMNVNPYQKEDLRTMTPHQSQIPATTFLSPSLPPMIQKHHIPHPSPESPPSITSSSIPSQSRTPHAVSLPLYIHIHKMEMRFSFASALPTRTRARAAAAAGASWCWKECHHG